MSFQDYCDDILDLHTGLMSASQIAEARAAFAAAGKKEAVAKHPDAGMKLAELIAKVSRLAGNQKIAIERAAGKDASIAQLFVDSAEKALAGKPKKAELLNLITLNSEASRSLNAQR
jgi:hypothetical protein